METTKRYKPPIMYMMIDTTGKTNKQIEIEITNRIDRGIKNELDKIKNTVTLEEYRTIKRKMTLEKVNMLKQFMFQIYNMEEINKKAFREEIAEVL